MNQPRLTFLHSAGRLYRTCRYLRPSQVARRVKLRLLRKIEQTSAVRKWYAPVCSPSDTVEPVLIRNHLREQTRRHFLTGPQQFSFLNRTVDTQGSWFPPEVSDLWLFNLHYFDFLFEADAGQMERLVRSWLADVLPCHPVAWHPYPLSLRLCNWIWNFSRLRENLSPEFTALLIASIKSQSAYLARHLEFDISGNHLIANLKGLSVAGVFLRNTSLIDQALPLLAEQIEEQILSDGGHFERSPMYHAIVLEDLIAISEALKVSGIDPPPYLMQAISNMSAFLEDICPFGRLPLLNDSAEGVACDPEALIRYGKQSANMPPRRRVRYSAKSVFNEDFGVFFHHASPFSFLFDVGRIGPDYLPGHAHNDTLSIQVWLENEPILTDSGVFEYQTGDMRAYFRSARAHNVLMIDGEEPNEIWKSFRVGRRGYPHDVLFKEAAKSISAAHDSYRRLGISVSREVRFSHQNVLSFTDRVINSGVRRSFESNLHFAPGVTLKEQTETATHHQFTLSCGAKTFSLHIKKIPSLNVSIGTSLYAPEFGIKQERLNIKATGKTEQGETAVAYAVTV